jgi:hypothetical protein
MYFFFYEKEPQMVRWASSFSPPTPKRAVNGMQNSEGRRRRKKNQGRPVPHDPEKLISRGRQMIRPQDALEERMGKYGILVGC